MNRDGVDTSVNAVHLETVYPHPPERVWEALTDPEALRQWLLPGDFRPKLGHRFRFVDRAPGGKRRKVSCHVVEIDAPRRLAYTWRAEGEPAPSLVTWTLEPVEGGTRVRLEHLTPDSTTAILGVGADPLSKCLRGRLLSKDTESWTDRGHRVREAGLFVGRRRGLQSHTTRCMCEVMP